MDTLDDEELQEYNENIDLLRLTLNQKLKNGQISQKIFDLIKKDKADKSKYIIRAQEEKRKRDHQSRIDASRCKNCTDIISGGTYGFIFQQADNTHRVIKASQKGHAEGQSCPEDFTHEMTMYSKIKYVFPRDLSYTKLINVYEEWVENRRCYYSMDKLYPIEFSAEQKEKIQTMILQTDPSNPLNEPILILLHEIINPVKRKILMLTPNINPDIIHINPNETANQSGGWRELNLPVMAILFSILDWDIDTYRLDLINIMKTMIRHNINISDVEFILAYTKTQGIGIYMIDFDKTKEFDIGNTESEVSKLLIQDMFFQSMKLMKFFGKKRKRSKINKKKKNKKNSKKDSKKR